MKPACLKNRPVLFLDSGIGGIPYCRHFYRRNPGESIVYLADRLNFPYGPRERMELTAILTELVKKAIKALNPKIAVLACNTATIAALRELREEFPELPFVGTVPAVKPAVLASKTGKIGLLGTELTVKEPYIRQIALQYGNCEIIGIAAPELVEFTENRLDSASEEEKKATTKNYLSRFREAGVDAIVLGCTHFLFLLENFQQEAAPDITVFESIEGISHRIESLLAETIPKEQEKNQANGTAPCNLNHLLLTGRAAPEKSWINWAERLGFNLSLFEEI